MKTRATISLANLLLIRGVTCLIIIAASTIHPVALLQLEGSDRNMQSSSTDFLFFNSANVLQSIENHMFSRPVQRNIHKLFLSRVQFEGKEHTYPSLQYTFDGFWNSWKSNMRNKLFFAGDSIERNMTIEAYSDKGKRLPDQAIIISGFEYGLANVALFLAQIMVDGIYADKCSIVTSMPENICDALSEEARWAVPMKKWLTVQHYSFSGWDYKEQLVEYVNRGMNRLEYNPDSKVDHRFIQSVSGVFTVGCHDVDSEGKRGKCPTLSSGAVTSMSQRRTAFSMALSALCIPRLREVELIDATLDYLKGRKDGFTENLLLYKSGEDFYPSQRYQFDDFIAAIEVFSKPPPNVTHPYPDKTKTHFQSPDHNPFYMGDPYMRYGHKYGLGNIALFFANGLHLSIEKEDACDEPNEHESNGRIPISNSCGTLGYSYQDMTCPDNSRNMACPVDEDMELTAVTFGRQIGSAPPLTCAPRSRIKFTGYWDTELVREEKSEAYANDNGRVDVSGCCWWGRGVLQTKGVCNFGRLNAYLGARSESLGRPSLFPSIDFCSNPEAICSSERNRELQWMSGLFLWIDRVQPYDEGGFNYMKGLLEFADSGFTDDEFVIKTHNIVKFGCHAPPCQNSGCLGSPTCADTSSESDDTGFMTKAYRTYTEVDLWSFPTSLGGSLMPSPSPTKCTSDCTPQPSYSPLNPTGTPSASPFIEPTLAPTYSPTSLIDQRMSYFLHVKTILEYRKEQIVKEIFTTPGTPVYTFDGFLDALEDVSTNAPDGLIFYLGQDANSNLGHGIANIALFLAHATTRGLRTNACEQKVNSDINDNCPMPIASAECSVLVESTTKRGIFLNQSPCDIGRLSYIYGTPAYQAKRESARYKFNFCTEPQVICYESAKGPSGAVQNTGSIKYLLGMVEWMDRIQSYTWGYWDYIERLKAFVDDGMVDSSFIDFFSTMVVKSPDDADLRETTFKQLLRILFSELKPNPAPVPTGSQEITIPPLPFDFKTSNPSKSPALTSAFHEITSSPTANPISPAPITPSDAVVDANNSNTPDVALPANTRVDLTNTSQTAVLSVSAMCVTISLIYGYLI